MKVNQLKAGVMLSYLTMFLSTGISIVYTPMMLNLLGQSEYGLYQLVASVVSYLSLLTLGFGGAYVRFYSRYKVKNDEIGVAKLNGMFLTVFSIIGVVALLCGSVLTVNVDRIFADSLTVSELDTAQVLMSILVVNVAISMPASVFNSYITANEQYFFQKILGLIKTLTNPFLMIIVLLMGYGSIGMVTITTLMNISFEIAYVIFSVKKLNMKIIFKGFDFTLLKEIAIFSSFIFMNIIVDQITWSVDKFLLGVYQSTSVIAIYAIGAQINTYYVSFATAISSVFVPKVNKLAANSTDNKVFTELFAKVGRIQFIVLSLILLGFAIFGKSFIYMWAGEDYSESYIIALILIIPVTIPLIQNLGIEIQRAKNLHKFRSWLYLAIAVVNLGISIPLCQLYGGIGSAIGTAWAISTGTGLVMNIYYHKKIGLNIIYFWKQIFGLFKGLIVPIILGFAIFKLIDLYNLFNFISFGILFTILFIVSMWFLGLNEYEKELFKKPIGKVVRKFSK